MRKCNTRFLFIHELAFLKRQPESIRLHIIDDVVKTVDKPGDSVMISAAVNFPAIVSMRNVATTRATKAALKTRGDILVTSMPEVRTGRGAAQ